MLAQAAQACHGTKVVAAVSAVRICITWTAAVKCSGPMLTTIHNLHYYLNLMKEVRTALETDSFAAFQTQFKQNRARGV